MGILGAVLYVEDKSLPEQALRQVARIGLAQVDIALWDLAGKYYQAPIYRLLGGYKERLPCYASTYHGDASGGLDSPDAYADFALRCRDMGYPAFKIDGLQRQDTRDAVCQVATTKARCLSSALALAT